MKNNVNLINKNIIKQKRFFLFVVVYIPLVNNQSLQDYQFFLNLITTFSFI